MDMVSSYSTGGGSQLIIEIFGRHQLVCSTRYLIILVAAVVFLCANDTMPRPEATVSSTNAPRNEYRGDKTKTKLDKQQKTNNEFKPAGFSGHESFVRLSSSRASGTPLRYKGFAVADFRDACITSWHQTRGKLADNRGVANRVFVRQGNPTKNLRCCLCPWCDPALHHILMFFLVMLGSGVHGMDFPGHVHGVTRMVRNH